jgi:hypothetical protein
LISNAASPLDVNGFIQAANISGSTPWWKLIGETDLYKRAPNDRNFFYNGKFATGMYTYLAPSSTADLMFTSYAAIDQLTFVPMRLGYPLTRDRFVASFMNVGKTSLSATFAGLTFVRLNSYVLEYRTDDPWFETETPPCPPDVYDRGFWLTGKLPKFYENPTHLQKLAELARGAGSFLRSHARKIGGALSALFPSFAPVFHGIANVFDGG